MRDILVAGIIFGALPFIFWRPQFGVMVWVWVSVMNPHRLAWGFSHDFSFAAIVAAATLVSALLSKDLKLPPVNTVTVTLFLFAAWTGVTTYFALYPDESYETWKTLMKTQLMAFLIPMLFHNKEDLRKLIWVIVLSIAYYGTKGGIWVLMMAGEERVWGPPGSYIEDNNALAVAIIMVIPLMRYLQLTTPHKYVRPALAAMMLFCGVAVLGTYSRGALLALSAAAAFLCWKSARRLPVLLAVIVAIPFILSFMPDKWSNRMETINAYEQDRSAVSRLNSWGTMFNIAKDRPIVGGGFNVAEKDIYERYAPDPTKPAYVAHSVYFQVLGEHGFVGLGLYLLLYFALWWKASAVMRATKDRVDLEWARTFSIMLQVAVIGFAVGGAFLSLANFDVPYYLVGAMVVTLTLVQRGLTTQATPAADTSGARAARQPADADTIGFRG
jgi:probable O-glycosylation ligase (exosortase A-associated)